MSFHQYSWNSEVETTWISLIGWPQKTSIIYGHQPNTYSYPRSAFFWFAADERPKVRAANPSFAVGDIAKELGKRWAEFGPTFKQKYEAKAEKDRERYVNAKQDFQQMLKDEKNGMHLFCLLEPSCCKKRQKKSQPRNWFGEYLGDIWRFWMIPNWS